MSELFYGTFLPASAYQLRNPPISNLPNYIGTVRGYAPDLFGRGYFAIGPFTDEQFAASNISPATGVAFELIPVDGRNVYGTLVSVAAANLVPAIKIPILKNRRSWTWWGIAPLARVGQFGNVIGFKWALQSSFTSVQLAKILAIWNDNSPVGNQTWVTYA